MIPLRIVLYLSLILSFSLSTAQEYIVDTEFYGPDNGLSGRYANCTYEDSRGVFWIGTQFGLSRFDGRDFLNFNEVSGLPFNQIMEIHEDSEGWLWLFRNCQLKPNCIRELAFIHSVTHEVRTFEEYLGSHVDLLPRDIESIVENEKGEIFFSAKKRIFQWFASEIINTIDFSELESTPQLITTVEKNKIAAWHHLNGNDRKSYVSYFVFDNNGKSNYSRKIEVSVKGKTDTGIRVLGSDSEYRKIIGNRNTEDVSYTPRFVILENGELSTIDEDPFNVTEKQKYRYSPIELEQWLNSKKANPKNQLEALNRDIIGYFLNLSDVKKIRQFHCYDNNIIWACGRSGAYRYQIKECHFQRVLHQAYSENEPVLKNIGRGIVAVGNDEYLMTTNDQIYNIDTKDLTSIRKISKAEELVPFAFTKGFQGDFWGCRGKNIFRLILANDTFQVRTKEIDNYENLPQVLCQYYEGERLWLGTNRGLYYFDHSQERWFELQDYNVFEELRESLISHIYEESKDRIWLCTTEGLYLFSPEEGILERYWVNGTKQFKLPVSSIYYMQPASKGGWWLATRRGIVYWNPKQEETLHYTTKDGLVTNEILTIHEDDFGFLWLATNAGLIQFHIETKQTKVWLEADGISSIDFEPHSYFVEKDGTVWMGTTNGYTVFNPKDFKDIDLNTQPNIPLIILGFEQYSAETEQLENRTQELISSNEIVLQPDEKLFNIRVALGDYVNGTEAKYAYRIKGVLDLWQEEKENLIRITGLPYGKHQLEIRGKLASGQYSAQEIHIQIVVLKPIYLQNWFLIGLISLFFGLFYLVYLWRVKRLTQRQKELEQEVKDRTRVIKNQSEELQELDKLKSRFFANVSHELRTPLTLMLGPTGSLLKRGYLAEKDRELLEYIYKNEKHLLNLVNEILDLSKLETNRLELKEQIVNLHDFLIPLVAQFKSYGDNGMVAFSFVNKLEKEYLVYLDISKFEKIINNFLSNALKFTPKGGSVVLLLEQKGKNFLIAVKDNGTGIHPKDLPHVFERFFQSKRTDIPMQGGTGIGLSMSRELAEILGGRVWVESELGEGSIFYFEFPIKEVQEQKVIAKEEFELPLELTSEMISNEMLTIDAETKLQNATILIVEDNSELCSYLKIILEEKYQVLTAENGKVALEILTNESVNFIISDLMMPIMDGFQLLEIVKSKDHLRHLPIIMLTARANVKIKLKALRIGVDDYMLKPFQEEELLARVENLLKNYRVRISMSDDSSTSALATSENPLSKAIIPKEDLQWLQNAEASVLKYLNDYRLNIDFLAGELAVSRSTLKRKLKQLTGLSANDYLNEIRFNKARELMETRSVTSVKAAAGEVGMKDVKYFSKQFKKRFGKLPSAYF